MFKWFWTIFSLGAPENLQFTPLSKTRIKERIEKPCRCQLVCYCIWAFLCCCRSFNQLSAVWRHFCCPISLFQGLHVACWPQYTHCTFPRSKWRWFTRAHYLVLRKSYSRSRPRRSACLYGGGGPQIGKVTCGGSPHLSCKRDQIKMRDYMDRRVTSPAWDPHLHVNRPLKCKGLYSLAR